jgi:hypothetical protein
MRLCLQGFGWIRVRQDQSRLMPAFLERNWALERLAEIQMQLDPSH